MRRNSSPTRTTPGTPAPRVRRPKRPPLERPLVLAALAVSIALAGCLGGAGDGSPEPNARGAPADGTALEGPQQVHVSLEGSRFVDAPGTIGVNDTITWTHRDGPFNSHTVTTDRDAPEVFDSSPTCTGFGVPVSGICMTNGDTFSHTFTVEGTYRIHCKLHRAMSMTVTVVADGAELPTRESVA